MLRLIVVPARCPRRRGQPNPHRQRAPGIGAGRGRAEASQCRGPFRPWRLAVRAGPADRPGCSSSCAGYVARRTPPKPDAAVVKSIADFLAPKRFLVLDNCAAASSKQSSQLIVEAILRVRGWWCWRRAERLAIKGERVQPVGRLPLPDTERLLDATRRSPCSSTGPGPCVRPRSRRGQPGGDRGREPRRPATPLATSRARIRSRNPVDLAARMAARLDLLRRQNASTLRAVLDWSYNLLKPTQRRLFDRLSVFSGSFDLAAAEAVGSVTASARQLVHLLASLVDASMISVGATDGRVRYSLLETLRGYGAEHLGAGGEADAVRLRHARHYASIAEQADSQVLRGPDEAEWVTTVDRELGNLRAAHQRSVQPAQLELALPALVRAALRHAVQVPR